MHFITLPLALAYGPRSVHFAKRECGRAYFFIEKCLLMTDAPHDGSEGYIIPHSHRGMPSIPREECLPSMTGINLYS